MSDEVLVHISTPATRENDELFRSLANAYTTFQPFQIHLNEADQKKVKVGETNEPDSASLRQRQEITMRDAATSTEPAASRESYGSFPSNISPEDRSLDRDAAQTNDGSIRPISRLAQLDRSYLSWRKRATPRASLNRGRQKPPSDSPDPEEADTGFIDDSQLAVEVLQSQLQDTYSTTSEDTSEEDELPSKILERAEKRSFKTVGLIQSRHREKAGDVQLNAVPETDTLAVLEGSSLNDYMDPLMHTDRITRRNVQTVVDQLDFSLLPVDAFPPAPTISVTHPQTFPSQITKYLAVIRLKNPDRFTPLKIQRSLEADERGYWLIDCMQWSPTVQWEFWSSLHEQVHSGRVGWGATLHCEAKPESSLGRVKLYCWGEVTEHMWLLLWLCSKGKLPGSGSKWIDANGIAVLQML